MDSKRRSTSRTKQRTSSPQNSKIVQTPSSAEVPAALKGGHRTESDLPVIPTPLSDQSAMFNQTMELVAQLLGAMNGLTSQVQQQQQQQLELTQLLTQVLQALSVSAQSMVGSSGGYTTAKRLGSMPKEQFISLNSKDLKKSHAKGSAEEKLRRAFQGIVTHNEQDQLPHGDKWAVNQNALAELTGCNRPAIKQFLKQNSAEIESHHDKHELLPRHNYAHGKVGTKITDIIRW